MFFLFEVFRFSLKIFMPEMAISLISCSSLLTVPSVNLEMHLTSPLAQTPCISVFSTAAYTTVKHRLPIEFCNRSST